MLWPFFVLPFVSASPTLDIRSSCDVPLLGSLLCQRSTPSSVNIGTPVGQPTSNGVIRYSVKYASANRWASPVMSTVWTPPDSSNPTALPLACPQPGLDSSQYSEDCLDLVLYVPPSAKHSKLPTIVWVHGGSFILGSATGAGLDGSNLAVGANAIVAVVQYRLGALGLLPPSSSATNSNLALQDLTTALTFLHAILPHFGGSPYTPNLTLAGQSSGATLIRALLGTPAVSSLYTSAWLHSDTVNYGFLTASALSTLRNAWVAELGCTYGDVQCAQSMDLPTLLGHQGNLFSEAPSLGPEFFPAVPIRPSPSGTFIYDTLTQPSEFPSGSDLKPLVVTTVKDDAAFTIYSIFPDSQGPMPVEEFDGFVEFSFGPTRAAAVINSTFYNVPAGTVDARPILSTLGTDQVWRCPAWKLARDWAAHGGEKQYVGVFTQGISYPGNSAVPECVASGAVCHQDDIEVVFGTGSSPSPLTPEIQARYKSFVRRGVPDADGYPKWKPATANNAKALNLGGTSQISVGGCVPTFWGQEVQFDYQVTGE